MCSALTRNLLAGLTRDHRTIAGLEGVRDEAAEAYAGRVPVGGILIWSGTAATIPSNWALCDGTRGTPDLRSRFVLGAGGGRAPGDTGGAESATTSEHEGHAHGDGTLAAADVADHSHGPGTYAADAVPDHEHDFAATTGTEAATLPAGTGAATATAAHSHAVSGTTDPAGGHGHAVSGTSGEAGGHGHDVDGETATGGAHTHEVAIMPPWYALAYIMRVA